MLGSFTAALRVDGPTAGEATRHSPDASSSHGDSEKTGQLSTISFLPEEKTAVVFSTL